MPDSITPGVLLVTADLFLGSRIGGAVDARGVPLTVEAKWSVAMTDMMESRFRLIIVDLETPDLDLSELILLRSNAPTARIVAYGPHVRTDLLQSARSAGCDEVMTRGRFDATLPELLGRFFCEKSDV